MVAVSRRIALSVLNSLDDSNAFPERLLHRAFEREPQLIRRDRALATELVYGVLRWRNRLDWVIRQLSKTPVHKIDPFVLNIIRLGLYQILFHSRIPVSAAVNDSVELAKSRAPLWVVRFINGVMRSAARKAKEIPMPDYADDPIQAIAIRESHPLWLVKRWVGRLGVEETSRLCKANNQIPPVTVRTNTLKVTRQVLAYSLGAHVRQITPTRFAPEGLSLRGLRHAVTEISAFKEGWFQVQDEAAQLITHLLDPKAGETILDACAGFGGKTGHIAQLMKDRGKITALENQSWKLHQLKASLARLGISSVTTWQHDLSMSVSVARFGTFDRVLLDAPCSGLGVLRRNPDAKWKKSEMDLPRLRTDQLRFLGCLAPLVKTGGRLVYCVCSLEPEEGEYVVEDFLKSQAQFVIDRTAVRHSGMDKDLVDGSGFFRSLPHEHDMDGFFAVRLKRTTP
ncbi:MAG: 16S rRNA (cytosine(967)-C(5))-methyltransferase RsmB [Deltaproteobacteria bacterium]|nr:16S rRNA (cytosine(967)-C(5))-methyltransferase RsmB [Deltaproteobacteria bacterium]MBW2020767.1 16S rRNA (cytosine(967)-C(5))-methyltransferase RsmB [Deltaproteobacteria bacterium]MBW2075369.1 16S rRNA (cytosine(967)-C(5))-methyltransferase RsmB [Deltaproteobacteria bacterium]